MEATVPMGSRPSNRTGTIIGLVLVAVVAIAAIGRFLTTSGPSPAAPAAGDAPSTTIDPIGALAARTRTSPDDPRAWRELGILAVQQAAITGDPALYSLAGESLDTAERLAPGDVETAVARGGLQLSLHEFADAYITGTAAVEQAPLDPDALAVLVDAATETGRYDEALAVAQRLLDRRPDASALARASYQRELRGDLTGALDLMTSAERSATNQSERASLAALVGEVHLNAGRVDDAAAAYDRALAAAPDHFLAALGQARTRAASGDLAGAITIATALVDRSPQPAAAVLLGELLTVAGRTDEAADAFALAEANDRLLAASGVVVDLESALFQADHGNPADAVAFARAAYNARRTVFTADALAWALLRNGRAPDALALVDEATALGTRSPSLRVHAAVVRAASGDAAGARDDLALAFEGSPWTAVGGWADAIRLAAALEVSVPASWQRPGAQ